MDLRGGLGGSGSTEVDESMCVNISYGEREQRESKIETTSCRRPLVCFCIANAE